MKDIIAICVLTNTTSDISGNVKFYQKFNNKTGRYNDVEIFLNVRGLSAGEHGFHIHEAGDLTDSCTSACAHFNPTNTIHGGPHSRHRHVGDLGNIVVNNRGKITNSKMIDHKIKLKGVNSIIGRCVVIHADRDDLGMGGLSENGSVVDLKRHKESLKTGNAGKRVACGVIGYSSEMFR